jgi:hypothetical protein
MRLAVRIQLYLHSVRVVAEQEIPSRVEGIVGTGRGVFGTQ